ncbi:hypothetical protein ACFL6Y_10525, partial [Elusimicrobiota bacterium]
RLLDLYSGNADEFADNDKIKPAAAPEINNKNMQRDEKALPVNDPYLKACKKGYIMDTSGGRLYRANEHINRWVNDDAMRFRHNDDFESYMRQNVGTFDADEYAAALDATVCESLLTGNRNTYTLFLAETMIEYQKISDKMSTYIVFEDINDWVKNYENAPPETSIDQKRMNELEEDSLAGKTTVRDNSSSMDANKTVKKQRTKKQSYFDYMEQVYDPRLSVRADPRADSDLTHVNAKLKTGVSVRMPGKLGRKYNARIHLGTRYDTDDGITEFNSGIHVRW